MSHFSDMFGENVILGFTKRDNSTLINNNPRIFLGYKNADGDVMKIGYTIGMINRKMTMYRSLLDINYDIDICDINTDFMEDRDIEYYNNYLKEFNISS
jgi:hypothetical protein